MRSVLRSGALVDAWFDNLPSDAHRDIARRLREVLLAAEPKLVPGLQWGNLMFAWERTHTVAIVAHRTHVNLQFFNGAQLSDRYPQLEGTQRGTRLLKCALRQPVDEELVTELVKASVAALAA